MIMRLIIIALIWTTFTVPAATTTLSNVSSNTFKTFTNRFIGTTITNGDAAFNNVTVTNTLTTSNSVTIGIITVTNSAGTDVGEFFRGPSTTVLRSTDRDFEFRGLNNTNANVDKTINFYLPAYVGAGNLVGIGIFSAMTSDNSANWGAGGTNGMTQHNFFLSSGVTTTPTNRLQFTTGGLVLQPAGLSSSIAASAALEIRSTTKGLLIPKMTKAQRDAISSPDNIMIYQTDNAQGLKITVSNAWYSVNLTADP